RADLEIGTILRSEQSSIFLCKDRSRPVHHADLEIGTRLRSEQSSGAARPNGVSTQKIHYSTANIPEILFAKKYLTKCETYLIALQAGFFCYKCKKIAPGAAEKKIQT